jgi:hypothetical protein
MSCAMSIAHATVFLADLCRYRFNGFSRHSRQACHTVPVNETLPAAMCRWEHLHFLNRSSGL